MRKNKVKITPRGDSTSKGPPIIHALGWLQKEIGWVNDFVQSLG